MTTLVTTLRYGDPPWLPLFAPSLEAWIERHGYTLSVWEDEKDPDLPCPKFCLGHMAEWFIHTGYGRMIYVDADVWVHPEAPKFPELHGLAVATDDHHRAHGMHFHGWCAALYGTEFPEWEYCNAGVWSIDRDAARAFVKKWVPPFVEYFQDQHFFNAVACRAEADGMPVSRLPSIWNMPGIDRRPAWFQHFWSCDKEKEFEEHPKEKP